MSACGNVNSTNMAEWRHTSSLLMRGEREGETKSEGASECSKRSREEGTMEGCKVTQREEETKRKKDRGKRGMKCNAGSKGRQEQDKKTPVQAQQQ